MSTTPRPTTVSSGKTDCPGSPCGTSPSQQEQRRHRVIAAALELATEGGYDAVQMRDVSARSQVALGTIYRYFDGKDHVLAAAMIESSSFLETQVETDPLRGETVADRLIDGMRRVQDTMQDNEKLAAALFTALLRPDPRVGECAIELRAAMHRVMATAYPAGTDPVEREQELRVIDRVWFSTLLTWLNGWSTLADATDEAVTAVHVVLRRS